MRASSSFSVFLSVVAVFLSGLATSDAAEFRFQADAVPAQTVWHSDVLSFNVEWAGHAGARFELTAVPEPFGVLAAKPAGDSGVFTISYRPAPADRLPFHVLLTATDGDASLSHTFDIIPLAHLPAEETVFETESHTPPVGQEPLTVVQTKNPGETDFNYQLRSTVRIALIGETMIFDEMTEDEPNLYTSYNAREDLERLELIADRVVIRSPLTLYGTDVHISARALVFEQDGRITTTPVELLEATSNDPNSPEPGVDGLPAGDLELHVGEIIAPESAVVFDIRGGRGQQGSRGLDGVRGDNLTAGFTSYDMGCGPGPDDWCEAPITVYTPPPGYQVIYGERFHQILNQPVCWSTNNPSDAEPGPGTPAVAGGQPGAGGAAGKLVSNLDLSTHLVQAHGEAGEARHYPEGPGGYPSRWVRIRWTCDSNGVATPVETTGVATTGAAADDPPAIDPEHPDPSVVIEGGYYSWVHPMFIRKRLEAARASYLGNRLEDAQTVLVAQADLLTLVTDDGQTWEAATDEYRRDLEAMYDEALVLLEQIDGGRDYFGNPAGWVPLLSFEVNATIFDQEIDRAFAALYLSYWIQNRADNAQDKVASLRIARDRLKLELDDAKTRYEAAIVSIPNLRARGDELEVQTIEVQRRLRVIEEDLAMQAAENLRPPAWEIGLRMGAKTAGLVCKMIPVYQPYLGAVGDGLTLVSNLDPDKPWDTIIGGVDVVSTCLDDAYKDAVKEQSDRLKKIDPKSEESLEIKSLDDLRKGSKALSGGLKDISGFLSSLEATEEEIKAELEVLKSQSDAFIRTVEDIESLLKRRRDIVDELTTAMRDAAELPNLIAQYLIELDAMNQEIESVEIALDPRTVVYLQGMERRANDRLLKYHYYLAKAYEYRLLKPYTEPLDLAPIRERIEAIGELYTHDDLIESDDYQAIKSLYRDKLAQVAEEIFDGYNINRPERSAPVRLTLTDRQLETLNRGDPLALDLTSMGLFSASDENIRIVDIEVFDVSAQPVSGDYGTTAYVDVEIEHSGVSRIKSDAEVYEFRHYTRDTTSRIVWGTRYDPVNDQADPIRPSAASESLLRSLLSENAQADMLLYSRPSAWADLVMTTSENDDRRNIRIDRLVLEVAYDFTTRNEALGVSELGIRVSKRDYNDEDELVTQEASFTPYFLIDTADRNGRQDGRGAVLRFYDSEPTVRVEAQPVFGQWQFLEWHDSDGNVLGTSPTAELIVNRDRTVFAHYVRDDNPLPNHAPTAPKLVSPEDGATGVERAVTLVWEAASDPDDDALRYFVSVCTDPTFAGCDPILEGTTPTAETRLAQVGLSWLAMLFIAGVMFLGRKRRVFTASLVLATALSFGLANVSCGGDDPAGPEHSLEVTLEPGTQYSWKVEVSDGRGAVTSSEVWRFETE